MKKRIWSSLAMSGSAFALLTNLAFASTTTTLVPTSEGNYLQLTPSTGTTHYTLVDESPCNGTTDYNYTTTVGNRDSYGINISSIGNGGIISQVDVAPCMSRKSRPVASCTFRKPPVSVEVRSNPRRFFDLARTSNRVQAAFSAPLGLTAPG